MKALLVTPFCVSLEMDFAHKKTERLYSCVETFKWKSMMRLQDPHLASTFEAVWPEGVKFQPVKPEKN